MDRKKIASLIRRLENCPPPHRVDLHREAIEVIKALLAELDGKQQALFGGGGG